MKSLNWNPFWLKQDAKMDPQPGKQTFKKRKIKCQGALQFGTKDCILSSHFLSLQATQHASISNITC